MADARPGCTVMRAFLMLLFFLAPQFSVAGVYMCIDPDTGKKTFTDRACEQRTAGEEVRVDPVNFGGAAYRAPAGEHKQAWRSQQSVAKSGRDQGTGYSRSIDAARGVGDSGE
jgi:hypothetical protein